jgi:hypothetical protein
VVLYGAIIVLCLGCFDMPDVIAALMWSVVVVVYLAYLLMFNREVLDTEPGDVSVFTH